mgnify:CR=1 FL=1
MRARLLGLMWLLAAGALPAQSIYETRDASGTRVFTDRPSPGARPVDLKPLNIIDPVPLSPAAPAQPEAPPVAAPAYYRFRIVFPEADGTVGINMATFEVRVAIEPPLRIADGHAFVFRMNGRTIPGRFTATENMVPPEFFGDTLPAGSQQNVIEASVIDAQGTILMRAAPVTFQTRFFNRLQRPRQPPGAEAVPLPVPPVTGGGRPPRPPPPLRPMEEPWGPKR